MQIRYVEQMPDFLTNETLYLVRSGRIFYDIVDKRIELGNIHSCDDSVQVDNDTNYYYGKIINGLIYSNKLVATNRETQDEDITYSLTFQKPQGDEYINTSEIIIKILQNLIDNGIELSIKFYDENNELIEFKDGFNRTISYNCYPSNIFKDNEYTDVLKFETDSEIYKIFDILTTKITETELHEKEIVYGKIDFNLFDGENNRIFGSDNLVVNGNNNFNIGNKNTVVYNNNSFCVGNNNNIIANKITEDSFENEHKQHNSSIGFNNTIDNCENSVVIGKNLTGYNNCVVIGQYNKTQDTVRENKYTGAQFIVGDGTDLGNRSSLWIKDGNVYGDTTILVGNADYAEYFEWEKIPNIIDTRGLFVTLHKNKIKLANKTDNYILGIVSATPGIIGGNTYYYNTSPFLQDVFGQDIKDENNQCIPNPEYSDDNNFISKENSPNWAIIGLMGQIIVVDDGTCEEGKFCYPGENGVATAAEKGYYVMERLDDNHIKVLFK